MEGKSRRLSREQIINEMEKEQDAIVVKLLKEIEALKLENTRLRQRLSVYEEPRKGSISASASMSVSASMNSSAILTDDEDDDESRRDSFLKIPTSPSHSRHASISSSSSNRRPSLVIKEQRQLELLEFKKRAAAAAARKK